jgi:hypothetical protein
MANPLKRRIQEDEIVSVDKRPFVCQSGFGMSHETRGSAIFGHFEGSIENIRIDSFDIDKNQK